LAAVAEAHVVFLYDLRTGGDDLGPNTPGNRSYAAALACDSDERWLAVEHNRGTIHCYDAASLNEVFELPDSRVDEPRRTELLFIPESPLLVQVETSPNSALRCWDLECCRLVYQSEVPAWNAWTIDERASELCAVTPDGLIRYDLKTGAEVRSLPFDGKDAAALAVSPVEELLAVGQGRNVRFVDPTTGDVLRTIPGQRLLRQIGFTADGKSLLALDTEGVLKFWEVAHGIPLLTWQSSEPIRRFSLSPDGGWLALTRDDHTEFLEIAPLVESNQ
jgi:WD40 repeat protein